MDTGRSVLEMLHGGELELPSLEVFQAERRRRSLSAFVQHYWKVLEKRPLIWNWHHEEICRALERVSRGELRRLVINIPPGGAKSTIVSVMWAAWEWLPGNWPDRKSLCVSGSGIVANRDSMKTHQVIDSPEYQQDMALLADEHGAPSWRFSDTQDTKELFYNSEGGFRHAIVAGERFTGARGDKIVIDDPLDVDDVIKGSPDRVLERMEGMWEWYGSKLENRRNDEATDPIVCIMQRLHVADLSAKMTEEGKDDPYFLSLVYPLEYDPELASPGDPREEKGEILDARRWPPEVVAQKRKMKNGQYEAQYGQRPYRSEGNRFTQELFSLRYAWHAGGWQENMRLCEQFGGIPYKDGVLPGLPKEFRRIAMSLDCASSAGKRSNSSVFFLAAEDWEGDYWVLDVHDVKMEPIPLCKESLGHFQQHRPPKIWIENASVGNVVSGYVEDQDPTLFPLVELIPVSRSKGAKEERAQLSEGIMGRRRIHYPDSRCPWMQKLMDQHLAFPKGDEDDYVDAEAIWMVKMDAEEDDGVYRSSGAESVVENGQEILRAMQGPSGSGRHVLDYVRPAGKDRKSLDYDPGQYLWGVIGMMRTE